MTSDVIEQLAAFGGYADSAAPAITLGEIESRVPADRGATVSARWNPPGWVIAATVAAVVLVVLGGLSVVLGGSEGAVPPADEAPVVDSPSTTTVQSAEDRRPLDSVWMNNRWGVLLTVVPPILPATPGSYEVTVYGYRSGEQGGVWVAQCADAGGVVDPSTWSGPAGDIAAICGVSDAAFSTGDFVDGAFETAIQVEIGEKTIRDGGVVITTGDIWVPVAGNVLLRVSDTPLAPWEQSHDRLDLDRLTQVITYWPPFVSTFNTTYESQNNCEEAYVAGESAQASYLAALEVWDDTTRDKPGFAYDTAVAEFTAIDRWLDDHNCPQRFVSVG